MTRMRTPSVTELRLVVTADDHDAALAFYRDALGLTELASYTHGDGHVTILDATRATLEINDAAYASYIDEVEVGRRVAGHIRVAFGVADCTVTTDRLVEHGAALIAAPTPTPWNSLNSRLDAPANLQLTLFTDL
jgi:predicted enzyme related to lactoylglutathione lyase